MTMKDVQCALLDAGVPAKLYVKFVGIQSTRITVRVRFRDRHRIKEVMAPFVAPNVEFRYRWTLTPWECRDLVKVVAYV
jgi:hypothetical protein